MRPSTILAALALPALALTGCGWKLAQTPIRIQGQVLLADTNNPIEGAYIDIADDLEKLDFALATPVTTDKEGMFDTTYQYTYDKWMWVGLPVFWLPNTPERIYVEVAKKGYRKRMTEIDYRGRMTGKTPVPLRLDPIFLHKAPPRGKHRERRSDE